MIYKLGKWIFGFYLRVFNKFVINGKENAVQEGPMIVFANHFSAFDLFALQQVYKNQIYFMAKKELFDTFLVSYFVKAYKAISVDREGNDIAAVKSAMKVLKDGNILGIFPEGTRVRDGSRPDAKSGLTMLAYKLRVPLQPVRIKYKHRYLIGNKIEVTVAKPVSYEDLGITAPSSEQYQLAANKLMASVYEL